MLLNLEKFSLPEIEEKVLKFWKTNRIFEKSLAKNAKGKTKAIFLAVLGALGVLAVHPSCN